MFTIDQSSDVAPFEQIKQHIIRQRDSGDLAAGFHLPPVRQLAADLGLAPNTVAKAYRELEAAGVIETRGRKGSFVTGTEASAQKAVAHAAGEFAVVVHELGVKPERALELVRQKLRETPADHD